MIEVNQEFYTPLPPQQKVDKHLGRIE